MSMQICYWGNPVLRKQTENITEITDEIKQLVKDMYESMYETNGIGLASPQIGKSLNLFVVSVPNPDDPENEQRDTYFEEVFINATITILKSKKITLEEGCLSIPGIYEEVERSDEVRIKYTNLEGEEKEFETNGLLSRCIQHESDHLVGKLFVDRLPSLQQSMIKKKLNKKYGVKRF